METALPLGIFFLALLEAGCCAAEEFAQAAF
jgi:hypothetical protein